MAKFKAGDMITDGETGVWLVNRIFIDDREYSFTKGKEIYSLDNGDGFCDARSAVSVTDAECVLVQRSA